MLTELCKELNNWFEVRDANGKLSGRKFGTFTISGGTLTVNGAQNGQYIRICGSVFNDGVYQYPVSGLTDETFSGAVWLMQVPPEIISLDKEIDAWMEQYGDVLNSPYQSESFGGYSYSKASGTAAGGSETTGGIWATPYAHRLMHWRKI